MSDSAEIPALDNTMGCLYIATVVTMGLWGMGSLQVFTYYNQYRKDQLWLKCLVFLVWALNTAHQALTTYSTYTYLISHYGDVAYLNHYSAALKATIMFTAISCALSQSLYIMRIYRLSKHNLFLTGFITCLVLLQCTLTTVYYVKCYDLDTFQGLLNTIYIPKIISAVVTATDVCILGVTTYLLHMSRSGFSRTENVINRLIIYAVNTGILTCTCAILTLVFCLTYPTTLLYIAFYLMLSRIYMDSMMASLNSRKSLRGDLFDSTNASQDGFDLKKVVGRRGGSASGPLNIKVETQTVQYNDSEINEYGSERNKSPDPSVQDLEGNFSKSQAL